MYDLPWPRNLLRCPARNAYAGDWCAGFGVGNAADDWLRLREDVQKVVGEEDLFLVARCLVAIDGGPRWSGRARAGVNLRGSKPAPEMISSTIRSRPMPCNVKRPSASVVAGGIASTPLKPTTSGVVLLSE